MDLSNAKFLITIDDKVYELTEVEQIKKIEEAMEEEPDTRVRIPLHINGNVSIIHKAKDNKDRIIAGYASVIEVDQEDQIIPKSTLEDGIQTLLENSEYANLMITHQNIQIGQILESYGELVTHVDDKGLFIVAKIRDNLKIANEIWERILNGQINGFSIAAEVILDHDECDDVKCVKVIDKMHVFEVSVCEQPVNDKSGFVVISKSKDECKVCDNNKGIDMPDKEKVQEEEKSVEEKSEVVEEPVEEKAKEDEKEEDKPCEESKKAVETSTEEMISNLAREVENMKSVLDNLTSKQEEFPEEEEEEEEEEMEEKSKDEPEVEEKSKPTEEVTYASKKDFDDLKKSVDELIQSISKSTDVEDLKVALKSKDDEISALTERIVIIEKSEEKPKAVVEQPKESKEYTSTLVKDTIRPGTFYKELE